MSAEMLSKAVNLLSFVALGLTILLIVRSQSGRTGARRSARSRSCSHCSPC